MATWFYAMHRLLRMKPVLKATIHQQVFVSLTHTRRTQQAIADVDDNSFWQSIYILLRAVFPALRTLRYCDSSKPAMDKVYYLSHRTTQSLQKSIKLLNESPHFGSMDEGDDEELEMEEGDDVFSMKFQRKEVLLEKVEDEERYVLSFLDCIFKFHILTS